MSRTVTLRLSDAVAERVEWLMWRDDISEDEALRRLLRVAADTPSWLPSAEEAESAVMSLMLEPLGDYPAEVVDYVRQGRQAICELLTPRDFLTPFYGRLFRLAKRLHEHRLAATLGDVDRLCRTGFDRRQVRLLLDRTLAFEASPAHAEWYARFVKAAAVKRRLLLAFQQVLEAMHDQPDLPARDCLARAEELVAEVKAAAQERPHVWRLPGRRPDTASEPVRERPPRLAPPRPPSVPVRRTVEAGALQLQGRTAYRRTG